jgi:pyruvate dehydrogenase E2 component (dihydrolipoamide acetyltransferase)
MPDQALLQRVEDLHEIARANQRGIWRIENGLGAILRELKTIRTEQEMEAPELQAALDALQEQVTQTNSIEASALLLIQSIPGLLNQAAGDGPDAVRALAASLNTQSQALAAAVLANTPATAAGPVVPPAVPPAAPADPAPAAAPSPGGDASSTPAAPAPASAPADGGTPPAPAAPPAS